VRRRDGGGRRVSAVPPPYLPTRSGRSDARVRREASEEPVVSAEIADLGKTLRKIRRDRRLPLAEVAKNTGISASFLSLIETGKSDITFMRLMKIVNFYGISITELLPAAGPSTNSVVVRKDEAKHLHVEKGIEIFLLSPGTRSMMLPVMAQYEPGAEMLQFSVHEGEEFIYVVEGIIEFDCEGADPITLRKGDSAYYRADRPHRFKNLGKSRARFVSVVSP